MLAARSFMTLISIHSNVRLSAHGVQSSRVRVTVTIGMSGLRTTVVWFTIPLFKKILLFLN